MCIRQGVLYLFGGMYEDEEDRQLTFKDFYSLGKIHIISFVNIRNWVLYKFYFIQRGYLILSVYRMLQLASNSHLLSGAERKACAERE